MADNFNPTGLPVIPTATSTTAKGAYKALTPLQKQADTLGGAMPPEYSGPTSGSKSEYTVEPIEAQAQRREAKATIEAELQATPVKDAFKESFGGYVRDIIRVSNKEEGSKEVDPNYDVGTVRQEFRSTYGEEHWDELERTRNNSQYTALVNNLKAKAKHDEVLGGSLLGSITGSLFDPIGLLTGGLVLKGGMTAARAMYLSKPIALAGSAVAEGGIYAGIEAGVQKAEFGEVYNPTAVAQTFAIAAALHFGVGAIATSKSEFMSSDAIDAHLQEGDAFINEARADFAAVAQQKAEELAKGELTPDDFAQRFSANLDVSAYPDLVIPAPVEVKPDSSLVDAGSAANAERTASLDTTIIKSESTAIQDTIDLLTADDAAVQAELTSKAKKLFETPLGKVAKMLSNTLQGFSSTSPVVRSATRMLGEDSTGIFANVRLNTAVDKARYNKLVRHHYASVFDEYKGWAKRNGKSGFTAEFSTSLEAQFNKKLRTEMEARWNTKDDAPDAIKFNDEARWEVTEPEVKRAADALDAGNQAALDLMKKHNVLGAEGLSDVSRGYVPRRMDGRALQDLHRIDPAKYKVFTESLGKRYHASFTAQQKAVIDDITSDLTLTPELKAAELAKIKPITLEKSQTIANGVMSRAIDRSSGIDGSTIGLFDKAARNEIEAILKSKGMDYSELEHTFAMLDKTLGKRTGSNRLKGRMEVDISTPDADTGINFLDFFDNDLNRLSTSYAEEMSGRIALAQRGISSDNDFENIIAAVRNENKSTDVNKDIQLLRDMHSVLLGRPLAHQGESKFVQFSTQTNSLQALGQVGVAQGAESSLSVAALGMGTMLKSVPMIAKIIVGARKNLLHTDDKRLLEAVESLNGPVGESWRIHRPRTEVLERLNADGAISHTVDKMLKAGQHINGFVSFMHQVMEGQLKTVAVVGTRKFAKDIQKGVLTKRLADAGFNQHSVNSIKKTLDAHAVFKNGKLYDLNLAKWNAGDADHFMANMERLSAQLIQQDFAGETASWMQKDLGRMLLSLRGYSIKAFNKQLIRNVNIADAVAAQSIVYGLAFSTLGYTAKMHLVSQFREDKEQFLQDRLTGMSLVQGAVGYMALSSFIPELVRPIASWSGAGDNTSGAIRNGGSAAVALFPALAPVDRAATALTNAGQAILGGKDYTAKHARQAATTLLGNSFPVALALNASLDDNE